MCNDQEAVEELLAFRADANWAAEGQDPLCVAVRRRMRGITRALLMHGADVDARSAGRPSQDFFFFVQSGDACATGCEQSPYYPPFLRSACVWQASKNKGRMLADKGIIQWLRSHLIHSFERLGR